MCHTGKVRGSGGHVAGDVCGKGVVLELGELELTLTLDQVSEQPFGVCVSVYWTQPDGHPLSFEPLTVVWL